RWFIRSLTPPTVRVELRTISSAPAIRIEPGRAVLQAASWAIRKGFGATPTFLRSGGTIPIVHRLVGMGMPPILMGFSLPDDRAHAPNEKWHLPTFRRAIETCIWFLEALSWQLSNSPTLQGVLHRQSLSAFGRTAQASLRCMQLGRTSS